MLNELAPILPQDALLIVDCISRRATTVAVDARRYVPLERVTAYFDDHERQCRTVVEIAVTYAQRNGRRCKPPRKDQRVDVRIARLQGFNAIKGRWGDAGHTEENHPNIDSPECYTEAFAYTDALLTLARSVEFSEYEKTGAFYRCH